VGEPAPGAPAPRAQRDEQDRDSEHGDVRTNRDSRGQQPEARGGPRAPVALRACDHPDARQHPERDETRIRTLDAPDGERRAQRHGHGGARGDHRVAWKDTARDAPDPDPDAGEEREVQELKRQRHVELAQRQCVHERHRERHTGIREALDPLAARVPHEAVALAQVARVLHGDHRVVPQRVDALTVHHEAGALDVEASEHQQREEQDREEQNGRAPGREGAGLDSGHVVQALVSTSSSGGRRAMVNDVGTLATFAAMNATPRPCGESR
jgi:hypothetical protein